MIVSQLLVAILTALASISSLVAQSESVDYANHTIFEFTPSTRDQLAKIQLLHHVTRDPFLRSSSYLDEPWVVAVPPDGLADYRSHLHDLPQRELAGNWFQLLKADPQVNVTPDSCDFTQFITLGALYNWLFSMAEQHSELTIIPIGNSTEERPIFVAHYNRDAANRPDKPIVVFEAGANPREWMSTAFSAWLINELCTSQDPDTRAMANDYSWYMAPNINPDGYVHSGTKDRLWAKTRSSGSFLGTVYKGVNADRNWDAHWDEVGTSYLPWSEIYPGIRPFSEIEVESYKNFLHSLPPIGAYFATRSSTQSITYPHAGSAQPASNEKDLDHLVRIGAEALRNSSGTEYQVGPASDTVGGAGGTSCDYAHDQLQVGFVICMDMTPLIGDKGVQRSSQIKGVSAENLVAIAAMLREARRMGIL